MDEVKFEVTQEDRDAAAQRVLQLAGEGICFPESAEWALAECEALKRELGACRRYRATPAPGPTNELVEKIAKWLECDSSVGMPIMVAEPKYAFAARLCKALAQEVRRRFKGVAAPDPKVEEIRRRVSELEAKLGPLANAEVSGLSGGGLHYVVCSREDSKLIGEGLNALAADPELREACRRERTRAERAEAELAVKNGTLAMTVARLGGIVEGHPTDKHNFLQRVDELRLIEAELASLRKQD